MNTKQLYYKYSDYLKLKYHEKVYKLPLNLPVTCPNRIHGNGCTFCAEVGTGFEALQSSISITDQLQKTRDHIEKRYNAHKYIAYFQNYTNTFMELDLFRSYVMEAAAFPDIVEISISTRPDCIRKEYMDVLLEAKEKYHISINIELGLQTVNYHTLDQINRGHGLAEFIDAVLTIKNYPFTICTHVILNLPYDDIRDNIETAKILSALHIDIVKIHSLYIAKNTKLAEEYLSGKIEICSKDDYLERLVCFLEYLSPDIAIERLFSRVPEDDSLFSNWQTSWWKLQDECMERMTSTNAYQGKKYQYLNGSAFQGRDFIAAT